MAKNTREHISVWKQKGGPGGRRGTPPRAPLFPLVCQQPRAAESLMAAPSSSGVELEDSHTVSLGGPCRLVTAGTGCDCRGLGACRVTGMRSIPAERM